MSIGPVNYFPQQYPPTPMAPAMPDPYAQQQPPMGLPGFPQPPAMPNLQMPQGMPSPISYGLPQQAPTNSNFGLQQAMLPQMPMGAPAGMSFPPQGMPNLQMAQGPMNFGAPSAMPSPASMNFGPQGLPGQMPSSFGQPGQAPQMNYLA